MYVCFIWKKNAMLEAMDVHNNIYRLSWKLRQILEDFNYRVIYIYRYIQGDRNKKLKKILKGSRGNLNKYFLLQNVCPEMGRLKACDKEKCKYWN